MKKIESTLTLNNKKYTYTLEQRGDDVVFVVCDAAKVAQEFPAEDVPALLIDLPNLIVAEQSYVAEQNTVVRFRVTPEERMLIAQHSARAGYATISDYIRAVTLAA